MAKKPNVPMTTPITTCRQKVDKKKYDENYDRIFRKEDKNDEKEKEERT